VQGTKTEVRPGVWRLRVYAGRRASGSPVQITRTLVTPEAAKGRAKPGDGTRLADRELARMVAQVAQGAAAGTQTVGDLLERWLSHCESIGRSPTTLREYRRLAEKVVKPAIGRVRLSKLSGANLDRLYAELTANGQKATSVRRVHALIGAALHQAERWDLVERNVARRASPPVVHTAQIDAPDPAQVRAIVEAAEKVEPALAATLLLAALTGARRGELCALRWSDVDWHAGTLTIARSVYEVAGGGWAEKSTKTHQARRIGLDDFALEVLRRHRRNVDALCADLGLDVLPDGFMFSRSPVGAEPYRPDVLTKFTIRMAKKADVPTHLHALRHFSATQAIGAGYDAVTVGARLGHADPSVTLRVYSNVLEQRDRDLAASLGQTLAPKSGSGEHPPAG
jgi:integrase